MVEAEAAEQLLYALVSIPSPSGEEAAASAFLAGWMNDHGFSAGVDASGSAVGVRGSGGRQVVLLGHIDTFPGKLPVVQQGRLLFGRGAVDAKGPLAAFAIAASLVDPPAGTQLIVIGATEEEAATSRGARHALEQYDPQVCIIGEPSGWDRITLGYKGRLLCEWSHQASLVHSASPVLSPAESAFAVWSWVQAACEDFNQGRETNFEQLAASLRSVNSAQNGAHGSASMDFSFRLPPGFSPQELENQLRDAQLAGDISFSGHEAAYQAGKNNPLVRALLLAIRAENGDPRFVRKTGTSDMNVVGPVWNCPIVAYGPGDASLDHTPEEHIDLDEFLRSIKVLVAALQRLVEE